jgi:hypothetical protein
LRDNFGRKDQKGEIMKLSKLQSIVKEDIFLTSPLLFIGLVKDCAPDDYEVIESELVNLLAANSDESDTLAMIIDHDKKQEELVKCYVAKVITEIQSEIAEIESVQEFAVNDNIVNLELDNAERARDMGAES